MCSANQRSPPAEGVVEPSAGVGPVALGGGGGDAEEGGTLIEGQAREVAELHQFGSAALNHRSALRGWFALGNPKG